MTTSSIKLYKRQNNVRLSYIPLFWPLLSCIAVPSISCSIRDLTDLVIKKQCNIRAKMFDELAVAMYSRCSSKVDLSWQVRRLTWRNMLAFRRTHYMNRRKQRHSCIQECVCPFMHQHRAVPPFPCTRMCAIVMNTVLCPRRPDGGTGSISCGTQWIMAKKDQQC